MLTDNNLVVLVLMILGLGLTMLGINKKMGVFNLLSIPVWILLGLEFIAVYPVLALTFIGLVIFEFYYAFWGLN